MPITRELVIGFFGLGLAMNLAAVFALVGSIFTFWVLGREDVEMWMARRSFGAV